MSNAFRYLSLYCEADIKFKKRENLDATYHYTLRNKPCFGLFTHSVIGDNKELELADIDVHVYQSRDLKRSLEHRIKNCCFLTEDQLKNHLKNLEFIFSKYNKTINSGVNITYTKDTAEDMYLGAGCAIDYYDIHIKADVMNVYQLCCLLTLIRHASEFPNNVLLRECYNMLEHGHFREFSPLSLFALAENRLGYETDQSIFSERPYNSTRNTFLHKPISLKVMRQRMTVGTRNYESTESRVQNFIPLIRRTTANIRKFCIPNYKYEGTDVDTLYFDCEEKCYAINEGAVFEKDIKEINKFKDALYNMYPKLIVDYPEFKNN